ncbi:MAG: hypothetical protein K1V72_07810 [Duncaniella sp.]
MTSKDIISPNEFLSVLSAEPSIDRIYPPRQEASRLLVSCLPSDYSASRIARAVEDADAHLLNLNVTTDGERLDNRVVTELRVSHRSPLAVARSLERYGYEVVDVEHDALADDPLAADRLNELMYYIDL